jgi:hypothetical protein
MAKPKPSAESPPKKPAKTEDAPPEVFGSEAAYTLFFPAAKELEVAQVIPMRADASLAYHNVAAGCDEVLKYEAHIKAHLPKVNITDLRSLPNLSLAVAFASLKANSERGASDTRPLLVEAHSLRRVLLKSADAAAEAGIFTHKQVARVKKGRGSIDTAGDCVALASMFTKGAAALKGKTAVTTEQVMRAAELGTELLRRLKPKGTRRRADAGTVSATEARDRLWTLLAQRHERLWAVGAYIFGHAVDERVPGLLSRMRRKAKKKPPEE